MCRQLTHIADAEFAWLLHTLNDSENLEKNFCIIATGGYGRMELAPGSDIDILYLYEDLSDSQLNVIVSHFNNYFYNERKEVGYACRTLQESKEYLDNMHSFNSILDSRLLLGSVSLFERFRTEVLENLPQDLMEEFRKDKISSLASVYNGSLTLHISEPNIKNGPLGLRDIQSIYWLEKAKRKIPSLSGLAVLPAFRRGEVQHLEQAYDFYLRLRNFMHSLEGRKADVLSIPMQPAVASVMGFGPSGEVASIDSLMKTLYSHESEVYSFVSLYLDYCFSGEKRTYSFRRKNILLDRLDNTLYPEKYRQMFTDHDSLYSDILNIFLISQEEELEISPTLLNEIRFASNFIEDNFIRSKSSVNLFLSILKSRKRIGLTLTLMHRADILGKFIPEFGACTNFSLFSYHHHYSVDEHTLLILRELDRLLEGTFEHRNIQSVFEECSSIHILALTILLHDVGKVKLGDHSQYGAELSRAVGERLGLSEEEILLLVFLVEEHILMSELSTKRDITDPALIREFAARTGNMDRLRLLFVLTIIDTKSVGRAVLTNWKLAILTSLYQKTADFLQNGNADELGSDEEGLENVLLEKENIDPELVRHITKFASAFEPEAYIRYYTPRRIYHHFRNEIHWRMEGKKDLILETEKEPAYVTMTAYYPDHKKDFLCSLAGTISAHALNLIGLRSFHSDRGFTILSAQITDSTGGNSIREEQLDSLKENLKRVYLGEITVEEILSYPREWMSFNTIPESMFEKKAEFDNDLHPEYTVLEVQLPDSLGLLYRILKTISETDFQLYFVRISTSADYAYDSFYLKNSRGKKIYDLKLLDSIRGKILRVGEKEIEIKAVL